MASARFRFDRFLLDAGDRRLMRDGEPVDLNPRYLDALILLAAEQGKLVSKDRFLSEVWRGVPVTDEALTQCIRTLRRQLGDDAGRPRFIETVPKHGYRFVAPVETAEPGEADAPARRAGAPAPPHRWRSFFLAGAAGGAGGGLAGLIGGLLYGFGFASQPLPPGTGAASVLVVLVCLAIVVGLAGGAGVGFGIAAAGLGRSRSWQASILGGAAGGLIVGAVVKLLGLDAFQLLFGRAPADITGAAEGALLGGAAGLGAWLGSRRAGSAGLRRSVGASALAGGAAGIAIALTGGRLLAGSLESLARTFPNSRLRLDQLGGLVGEAGFGPITRVVTSALEGMLFGACVVGAMILAQRTAERSGP